MTPMTWETFLLVMFVIPWALAVIIRLARTPQ